jgi:hypothetical protein
VFVEGWQQECCGKPFRVGSKVSWWLVAPDADREWFDIALGVVIDADEEHHGDQPKGAPKQSGVVRSIRGVAVTLQPDPDARDLIFGAVAGSAVLTRLRRSDGREMRWMSTDRYFMGYLVELELVQDSTPASGDAWPHF